MKNLITILVLCTIPFFLTAQVNNFQLPLSINTTGNDPVSSAILDVQSTDKGLLIPRMTTAQRNSIAGPATGLIIYNVTDSCFNYFSGLEWVSDASNELQSLSLSGTQLTIVDGNTVDLASIDTDTDTDDQTLSLSGTQLSIADGNSVDLSPIDTDTDDQTLSLSGTQLTIADGNTVDLASIDTDTDDQTLSFSGTQLNIADGNSVDLVSLKDNLGDHSANQTLTLNGHYLSGDGDPEGVYVTANGRVGIGLDTADQRLHIFGSTQLMNGDLIFTNNFTAANLSTFRKSLIDASFSISGPDTIQNMIFKVSDGTYNSTNDIMTLTGNGHVGIGTTTPSSPLHIEKTLNSGTLMTLTNNGFASANVLKITSGSTGPTDIVDIQNGAFVVEGSGNVGIGTTNPASRLDVAGGNISLNGGYISNDGDSEGISMNNTGNVGIGESPTANTKFRVTNSGVTNYTGLFSSLTSACTALGAIGLNDPTIIFQVIGGLSTRFMVQGDGRIGIGTINPTQARVVINGDYTNDLGTYGFLNASGSTGQATGSNPNPYSLYASERIAASEFNAHSDMRIKNILGTSNTREDLATLMQIEVTDFTLRDTIAKGKKLQKKVIAQQVAQVYPQAVFSNLAEVVPDIYRRAAVKDGWIMLATDLEAGERVKIITENGSELYKVRAIENNRFQVAKLDTGSLEIETVFVYGREVDDFHTVDYEAISMLNVSASQELARLTRGQQQIIDEQEAEIEVLKEKLQQLENQYKAENSALYSRLSQIEALLEKKIVSAQ